MEIAGYLGAILMGLSLGLIGGGGSILTVPILVYLFKIDTVTATAYSLFIVGVTSIVGSHSHLRVGNVHWRMVMIFGIPSVITIFLTRLYIVPSIPNWIFSIGNLHVTKSLFLLILFAVLMLLASYSMIRNKGNETADIGSIEYKYPLLMGYGVMLGLIAGMVGAGGGFLIIPALVLLAKLPMKRAIGTSLMIIALNSLIGFLGDLHAGGSIDWRFLLIFSSLAVVGILIGSRVSRQVPNEKLKPAFGWFVLFMGLYIILNELFLS